MVITTWREGQQRRCSSSRHSCTGGHPFQIAARQTHRHRLPLASSRGSCKPPIRCTPRARAATIGPRFHCDEPPFVSAPGRRDGCAKACSKALCRWRSESLGTMSPQDSDRRRRAPSCNGVVQLQLGGGGGCFCMRLIRQWATRDQSRRRCTGVGGREGAGGHDRQQLLQARLQATGTRAHAPRLHLSPPSVLDERSL